jgi:hypothetical protein
MNVEISEAQATVLRELLDSRIGSLSSEIRHTDNPTYRQGLREQRDHLRSLLLSIAPVAA